ncbi:MAG: DUF1501 domain-containing protein [Planctomycetes bacterium]|nr:DUF1501 domain-containing protein [Planctomycetota bacterium]
MWGVSVLLNISSSSRREFLQVGALGLGGLTLTDLLRMKAHGATGATSSPKSVIMIYLPGGPSHIDMYDMKPNAPEDFRGDFKPIRTNVPGLDICEHMPLQSQIADKFTIVRGLKFRGKHDPYELLSGYPSARSGEVRANEKWPVLGSVVSRLHADHANAMPPYVNLNDLRLGPESDDPEVPRYLGPAHAPFRPSGPGLANLRLPADISLDRLDERKSLLGRFDHVRRDVDASQGMSAMDPFQREAIRMVTSGEVYKALDLSREDLRVRDRFQGCTSLLLARRLVEAGVSVVTVAQGGVEKVPGAMVQGAWDTHKENFRHMRKILPEYDRAIYTLLTDLYQRGLDQKVAVVIWGEFGRTPRVGTEGRTLGAAYSGGRDHWWEAGFALFAGGGLRMGQVIGETDARAERSKGRPYSPQNVLATLYHVLGINPATAFPDYQGRPVHLLEDREKIKELT